MKLSSEQLQHLLEYAIRQCGGKKAAPREVYEKMQDMINNPRTLVEAQKSLELHGALHPGILRPFEMAIRTYESDEDLARGGYIH